MGSLDLFAPGTAPALVLVAMRVGGMLLVAPVFAAKSVSVRLRTGLLLLFTMLLAPSAVAAAAARGTVVEVTPASFLTETLIGFAVGFGAAVLVGAVETAGDLMTTTIGLSGATLFDPVNGTQSTVLANFANLFALTVLLALDGHLVMLDALAESVRAVPVGGAVAVRAGLATLVHSGATLFVLGLRFAAPVIAASLIGNTALAVLTRVAPSLNVLTIAFPLQIGVGLMAITASLALVANWMTGWTGHYAGALGQLFAALDAH